MPEQTNQSAARLSAVLAAGMDPVFILNERNVIAHASLPQGTVFGKAAAYQNQPLEVVFPPGIVSLLEALREQTNVAQAVCSREIRLDPEEADFIRPHGLREVHWLDARMVPVSGTQEVILTLVDKTRRRLLENKLTKQAQRDPLTGAYNRRALMPVLAQSIAQAQRYDWVCSLMLIDIDNFSELNEQYTWDGGDQALQQLVAAIHRMKRTADFLARYGDDQLVMFMPETNNEQSQLAAERVRKLAEELEIPYPTGNIRFTVSIGTAAMRDLEDSGSAMLKRAEENLFIAKQCGSNRIEGEEL